MDKIIKKIKNKKKNLKILIALMFFSSQSWAQHLLEPIKIFGGGERSQLFESVTPTSKKTAEEIQKSGSTSVGDAVSNLPGVNSSGFSPQSTRPIIRGLDGERIRVLIDELGTLDVSGTSADHVVPINPLLVDSIEVVRGPISLLYGSSALGGVVNIVSSRKHTEKFSGLSGAMNLQGQTVNNLGNLNLKLDYGLTDWIFHFDANYAKSGNLKVPTPEEELINTQSEQYSFNLGSSYFYNNNKDYLNLSFTNYNNIYGIVTKEDVSIDTQQNRLDFSTKNVGFKYFKDIETKNAISFYEHQELEGDGHGHGHGHVGTEFKKLGLENRVELNHKANHFFSSGVSGFHNLFGDFEASGEEAFLPSANELNSAAFTYQEINLSEKVNLNLGARVEFAHVAPQNLGAKDYLLTNLSLGSKYQFNKENSLSANLSYNERNPNNQELFSNGAHLALGLFERGQSNLSKEAALGLDLSYKIATKNTKTSFNFFANSFNNYIALFDTNTFDDTDESGTAGDSADDFKIFEYTPVDALLYGGEITFQKQLARNFELKTQADILIGKDLTNGAYLPRLTPPRVFVELSHNQNSWLSYVNLTHVFEPLNLAPNETNTESYFLTNLGLSKNIQSQTSTTRLYAQVTNLFNEEARNHSSYTKDLMQFGSLGFMLGLESAF